VKLARVTGNVVATVKHATYRGHKLMVVQPIDETGKDVGEILLAVDLVQAGPGDTVLIMQEGNGVRQILKEQKLPIRSVIIGIVDAIDTASA
jgi:ethanolamine utilization protein EutN